MTNQAIAELISHKLISGIPHPGYKETEQPPSFIRLPLFRAANMPPEMYKQVEETVKMIGEAIVYAIETEGESVIIKRAEIDALRSELATLKGEQQ